MATPPADQPFRTSLTKELSTVNIAIGMSSAELTGLLDRTVPKELYNGGTRSAGLSARVVRNGGILIGVAGDSIDVSLPVAVSLSYGIFETPAISTALRFRIIPRVSAEWRLEPTVTYTGLTDNVPDQLKLGPLILRPRSVLDGLMEPLQRRLSAQVTGKLNEKLNLKAAVAKVWTESQKPVCLDRERKAWLVLRPREVLLYPILARHDQLKLAVGLKCFAEIVIGPAPAAPVPVPLPPLTLAATPDKKFAVAVNSDLFYKDLLQVAAPLLLGKVFSHDGRSVTVKGIDVYGNGDALVVKVDTAGALDGTIYLTCKPVFDRRTNKLSVDNVEFDLQTRDLLVRSADWLLHSRIREMMQEKLNLDLTSRLAQAQQLAGNSLARVRLNENIYLTGKLTALRLTDLIVQRDRLSLQVYGEGETEIIFH
jgi:hypothetical protein